GEFWYNATNDKLQFTSYERDPESGNDYAMARYHINRLGRFASKDPVSGSLSNPQSLNLYAYVSNNPTNTVDPAGTRPAPALNIAHMDYQPPQGIGYIGAGGCGEFEAIEGEPGCYTQIDFNGGGGRGGIEFSYGFSVDLYNYTLNTIDSIRLGVE